ncbi:sensor histidine kinase [Paraglaciecola aestuariivivens]
MNSKNTILTTLLMFFITLEVLIALDFVSKQDEMRKQRVAMFDNFIALQNQIGYVGLIHNFKNAILRPEDPSYIQKAHKNIYLAIDILKEIESSSSSANGNISMPHTYAMISAYQKRLSILPNLLAQGLSVREIDQRLRFDDQPSHTEIQHTAEKVTKDMESKLADLSYRSLKFGFIVLLALLLTIILLIRFFFKEQQQALHHSQQLNEEMEKHKADMLRSQSILLSVMQDVEKEKGQTHALNDQLTRKNKEMEQFIYTVSHDLKSPLVTISGFTQKLLSELNSDLSDEQKHRFHRITQNIKNMEALLTDLLDISRIAQQAITTMAVDIKGLIARQCRALEEEINNSHATIQVAKELHKVNANPRLFSEALLNLLSNAIRYRDPSRKLIVEIFTTRTADSTIIHVKDNGIGIDPKYHKVVFDIFESLSKEEGTGVGLTIVKTIMQKHHGEVSLASELGAGCCFSLTFPDAIDDDDV